MFRLNSATRDEPLLDAIAMEILPGMFLIVWNTFNMLRNPGHEPEREMLCSSCSETEIRYQNMTGGRGHP